MSIATNDKLILVIGATGAQGIAVIKYLIDPDVNGATYRVRALTRNLDSARAKELSDLNGVELFKGNFYDIRSIEAAMKGCYGVFVNTDTFQCGEEAEIYLGMRIFEAAKMNKQVKHWVWSSLDSALKLGGYNHKYLCDHYNAKARVADWLKAQESDLNSMVWSAFCTGPYIESLNHNFAPFKRKDGTYVFAAPVGSGHVPLIALNDIGFFVRYIFDHRKDTSAANLKIASEMVSWPDLIQTFTRVTGKPAVFVPQTIDEYFSVRKNVDHPLAVDLRDAPNAHLKTTFRQNFAAWWSLYADDIIKRDMDWINKVNPNVTTVEKWMRESGYTGDPVDGQLLKIVEDAVSQGATVPVGAVDMQLVSKLYL